MRTTSQCRVALIGSLGDDLAVVNSARVSLNKEAEWKDGVTDFLHPKDAKLIGYLADNEHFTPFCHVMVTLRIACPVFVARQWFRHVVGVARNEISRRYVDEPPEYFIPTELRERPDGSIKQGSGGRHPASVGWLAAIDDIFEDINILYQDMIADGVAPEQARIILPLAHMTEFYETASLAFYARVARLRMDNHAQKEINELATEVAKVVSTVAPVSWKALTDGRGF